MNTADSSIARLRIILAHLRQRTSGALRIALIYAAVSGVWILLTDQVVHEYTTELLTTEEMLRESEPRYRLLFENNPHPMWVYDLDTLQFLAVNEAAINHYGYTRAAFLSLTIKDIRSPEDVPALLDDVAHTTAPLNRAGIWRHHLKDGTLINVEITSHLVTFGDRNARRCAPSLASRASWYTTP